MTIRKNDPNSPFWRAAEAASQRVAKFPPWKLGKIEHDERKPPPPESLVDALQDRVHRDPGRERAANMAPRRTAEELVRSFEEGRGIPLRELFGLSPDDRLSVIAGMVRHARGLDEEPAHANMDSFRAGFHLPESF